MCEHHPFLDLNPERLAAARATTPCSQPLVAPQVKVFLPECKAPPSGVRKCAMHKVSPTAAPVFRCPAAPLVAAPKPTLTLTVAPALPRTAASFRGMLYIIDFS